MDLGLSGKACIVTGATSGIGLATANALRAEGAQVLGVARRDAIVVADGRKRLGRDVRESCDLELIQVAHVRHPHVAVRRGED